MIDKFLWALRAVLYFPFFGKIRFPSYIGRPIIIKGSKNIFLGKYVRIYPNIRLETYGEKGFIKIKDDVSIGQNVHITSSSNLVIGKSTSEIHASRSVRLAPQGFPAFSKLRKVFPNSVGNSDSTKTWKRRIFTM